MKIGLVAIGRNEGERLERCLRSARAQVSELVYVDSGSRDQSVAVASGLGAQVVQLDARLPFTAARARNEGFRRLLEVRPDVELVQFVDGDCELAPGWIGRAADELAARPEAAIVCGRRRERFPKASVYNHLCDLEWATPVGLAQACGGDFMVRRTMFQHVGGFDAQLIAGEEPDLCARLRQQGWEIWRIDAEMTMHDAAMRRLSQWWQRNVRSGHASAEAWQRRGSLREPRLLKEIVSNLVWSLPTTWPAWPLLWWRVYRRRSDARYAAFIVLGKLPHAQGQLQFWWRRARGVASGLIEYK